MSPSSTPLQVSCLLLLALLPVGCGGSGSTGGDLGQQLFTQFFKGDAYAEVDGARVDFGPGGAPADGTLEKLLGDIDGQLASLPTDALLESVFLTRFAKLERDERVALDWKLDAGSRPIADPSSWTSEVPAAAVGTSAGTLAPAGRSRVEAILKGNAFEADLDLLVHAGVQETPSAGETLPLTWLAGLISTGLEVECDTTELPGWASQKIQVALQVAPDSSFACDDLQCSWQRFDVATQSALAPSYDCEFQPTTTPGPGDTTSGVIVTVPTSLLANVEIGADDATTYGDIGLVLRAPAAPASGPLDPQVFDVGSGNEGVHAVDLFGWNALFPGRPLGPEELGLVVTGGHHVDVCAVSSSGCDSVDARAQPVDPLDDTYDCALLYPADGGASMGMPGTSEVDGALACVGSWGLSIANFDDATNQLGPDVVVDTGNMTDVCPFGYDPRTGDAVYVDNEHDQIKYFTQNADGTLVLDPDATLTNAAWPGASGKVVSACRHTSGDLLFVTDGEPGELWLLPADASTASKIADAGNLPRRVRALRNIAVVSAAGGAFSFGSLSFLVRSAAGTWQPAPAGGILGSPVGIDLKADADGNVLVASTDSTADLLDLFLLDGTTGEILASTSKALPAECHGPGHCSIVRRPGVDAVWVSCHDSDNVALMPVDFGN